MQRNLGYFAELEGVVTCQNEEMGLSSRGSGCVLPCLERLQCLYNSTTTPQAPRSTRENSVYNAVWASAVRSASPRN